MQDYDRNDFPIFVNFRIQDDFYLYKFSEINLRWLLYMFYLKQPTPYLQDPD